MERVTERAASDSRKDRNDGVMREMISIASITAPESIISRDEIEFRTKAREQTD